MNEFVTFNSDTVYYSQKRSDEAWTIGNGHSLDAASRTEGESGLSQRFADHLGQFPLSTFQTFGKADYKFIYFCCNSNL